MGAAPAVTTRLHARAIVAANRCDVGMRDIAVLECASALNAPVDPPDPSQNGKIRSLSRTADAAVEFVLNGRRVRAAPAWPQMTLLEFLRAKGLSGAKEGCAEGECGACSVVLVAPYPPSNRAPQPSPLPGSSETAPSRSLYYRVINSCLMFLPMAAGHQIYTVESLAVGGELAATQQVMAAAGGSQCGYCTPGFVMSLFAEQYRPDRTAACDPLATAGNLCRCTGYRAIRDAALALGPPPAGAFPDRLTRPAPTLEPLACDRFVRPGTVDECVELLATFPAARIVGGGTDLGVESNIREQR